MKILHTKFIVQNHAYEQHYGYPLWCAHVVVKLHAHPPASAKQLIEQSAAYMHDKTYPAYQRIYSEAMRHLPLEGTFPEHEAFVFGPAANEHFGELFGQGIKTDIGLDRFGNIRGYYETMERNQPEWMASSRTAIITFSYPIPKTTRHLALMRIGREIDLFPEDHSEPQQLRRAVFRHPKIDQATYDDLIRCLDPLYQSIRGADSSLEKKTDDLIACYWLLAQSTPTIRGGSAQARIVLEYLASCIGIELPHVRIGYDLWAEAATTSVDQFAKSFNEGIFFDPEITDISVQLWQSAAMPTAHGSAAGREW